MWRNDIYHLIIVNLSCVIICLANLAHTCTDESNCNSEAAWFIRQAINTSVDPCDNFYQFACGGWLGAHPVPDTKTSISISSLIEQQVDRVIRAGLQQSGFHSSRAVRFGAHLYRKCNREETDVKSLHKLLQPLGGWNIGIVNSTQFTIPWHEAFFHAYTSLALDDLITVKLRFNPGMIIIFIDTPELPVAMRQLKESQNDPKRMAAYREYIRQSAEVFCYDCPYLDYDIETLVNFEMELLEKLNGTGGYLSPEDYSDWWLHLIAVPMMEHFNVPYHHYKLDLRYRRYLDGLMSFLSEERNTRAFHLYLGWQVIRKYGPLVSEYLRQVQFEFNQLFTGVEANIPRNEFCLDLIKKELPWVASRLLIERDFAPDDKHMALQWADAIQAAFQELVFENEWMDEKSQTATAIKLSRVHKNVGYPEWLLEDTILDQLHHLDNPLKALMGLVNPFIALLQFKVSELSSSFDQNPKVSIPKWRQKPFAVNAFSQVSRNEITIPAANLRFPYFHHTGPHCLNFGAFGGILGHEYAHQLDNIGRLYDENRNRTNWWSKETIKQFNDRIQCFAAQYYNQEENYKLNVKAMREAIADNASVRIAYRALQNYRKWYGSEQSLEGLPYSAEQLFFISYAHSFCRNHRVEKLERDSKYSRYAPTWHRVNMPLANMNEFATAFNCSATHHMNPSNKCLLW